MNVSPRSGPVRSPMRSPNGADVNHSASILRSSGKLDRDNEESKERTNSDNDNILVRNQSLKMISIENEDGVVLPKEHVQISTGDEEESTEYEPRLFHYFFNIKPAKRSRLQMLILLPLSFQFWIFVFLIVDIYTVIRIISLYI